MKTENKQRFLVGTLSVKMMFQAFWSDFNFQFDGFHVLFDLVKPETDFIKANL